jgi:hypothetical protein
MDGGYVDVERTLEYAHDPFAGIDVAVDGVTPVT